jgi:hypothetical protein
MSGMGNLILLITVAIAAFLMFFVVCPWFDQIGHKGVCYVGYGLLIVTLLYARTSSARKPRIRPKL